MIKSGYLENVYCLSEDDRTIPFPNLPPLILQTHYNTDTLRNCKILRCAWIYQASTKQDKVIVLDEIQINKTKELRLRYNIIGVKPRMRGKWVFGQFATFVSPTNFKILVKLAKKHNMF